MPAICRACSRLVLKSFIGIYLSAVHNEIDFSERTANNKALVITQVESYQFT